ncbi:MAG TPA: exopolysaccharide biosynthesis polyprenyl glycosylphosphotransferase [Flavobacterium sp.]|uniref:exopolysaccharide biosynthesis polyprenyl glycosylphosphotransferase n=1 Tax=Flavobacterium sp. TaxID=239 RepID=UPI002B9648F2|nr:exopolysaccharide biosynthesis polyprenyl glycosylphosphotransferase [Flavobacterium sp.]MCA0349700.1 exopolysaccharide biosynthesis polyprenyl glycosylphosphotransferase [Bacteroidota bacterium]HPW98952.1 exopolysaccharide biosynthesis polyprenyl glycosylphosphotransferase [Flavobacterium sp.]HQA73633.1 exopolysaccharide biosynthesis polyprenyl glycosylphosphotransferase [Flavobacterium sp.]
MKKKEIHFEISERKILLRLFDVLSVFLSLYFVSLIFKFDYFNISTTNFYWTIVLGIYLLFIGSVFEMYNLQVASNQFQIIKSSILTSSTTVLLYLLTPIYTPVLPSNRIQILIFFLAIFGALFIWRMIYVRFFASNRFVKKVILVCDQDQVQELVNGLESVDPHYKVLGFVNSDSNSDRNDTILIKNIPISNLRNFVSKNSISEIVVASQKTDGITVELYNQLITILENGFIIREYTQVYESITQRIPVQYVSRDFYRYFPFSRSNQNHLYLLVVRFLEILLSLIGLAVGIALIPFVIVCNAFWNKGKLFYKQERVGKNGKVFNIVKFRTMVKNAEQQGAVFATSNDSRITPFGKILRKSRIDEFPQFINIFKGEMAVIGPRPERPIFVKEIAERMPFYETRHVIKPGLTGWAQVNYSYGETIDDSLIKLQYDLYYIKHRSLFLDFNIIFKTLSTVLFYRGQ